MKIFKLFLLPLFLLLLTSRVYSTSQYPDYLIYKGDTLPIFANPLESYFDHHPRPDSLFEKRGNRSTACWRGYIAYWELKNDSLFLLRVEGDKADIELPLIFNDKKIKGKVFANWYSYSILNPYGELLNYEHMGYNSIYQYEKEFIFKKGKLKSIKLYDNSKSKKSIYTQDESLLKNHIDSMIKNSQLPKPNVKIKIYVCIADVDDEGRIKKVKIARGYNKLYDQEAMRIVKSIPGWDVLYYHGVRYQLRWCILITFNAENDKK